jgi:hypothetical protein
LELGAPPDRQLIGELILVFWQLRSKIGGNHLAIMGATGMQEAAFEVRPGVHGFSGPAMTQDGLA